MWVGAELMLLGFISLLLTVFQSKIIKICVNKSIVDHLLPCSLSERDKLQGTSHLRHLLAEETTAMGYCALKVINLDQSLISLFGFLKNFFLD